MTTHHMFTAVEAQALLESATPGSWSCEPPREVISLAVARVLREGSCPVAEVVAEHASLVAAAPDLAASVVALHAEVEHLRSRISTCWYCGQSVVEGAGGHTSGCYEIKLNELKRIVALERGDESAALPGWHWNQHALHWWSDDGWSIWRGNGSSWQTWLGRTKQDYTRRGDLDDDCPIESHGSKSFHTVWDAMNAKPSLKA